jgi:hypothetical protein
VSFRGIPNWIPPPTPTQPGGLALGSITLSALRDVGISQAGIQWVYSPGVSRSEFPPHRALAGMFFDFLPTPDGWYPGDHKGCLCGDVPVLRGAGGRFVTRDLLQPPDRVNLG